WDAAHPFGHQFAGLVIPEQLPPNLVVIGPHVGFNDARAEGVDGDGFLRDFLGEALSDADHGEFRGGVMRRIDEALARLTRGGVDEATAALVLAHPRDRLLT